MLLCRFSRQCAVIKKAKKGKVVISDSPKVEVFDAKDIPAEVFDDEGDAAVLLFQTDMHYEAAHKPAHMSLLSVGADGSIGAATSSEHATMPGGKTTMVFGADGSVY